MAGVGVFRVPPQPVQQSPHAATLPAFATDSPPPSSRAAFLTRVVAAWERPFLMPQVPVDTAGWNIPPAPSPFLPSRNQAMYFIDAAWRVPEYVVLTLVETPQDPNIDQPPAYDIPTRILESWITTPMPVQRRNSPPDMLGLAPPPVYVPYVPQQRHIADAWNLAASLALLPPQTRRSTPDLFIPPIPSPTIAFTRVPAAIGTWAAVPPFDVSLVRPRVLSPALLSALLGDAPPIRATIDVFFRILDMWGIRPPAVQASRQSIVWTIEPPTPVDPTDPGDGGETPEEPDEPPPFSYSWTPSAVTSASLTSPTSSVTAREIVDQARIRHWSFIDVQLNDGAAVLWLNQRQRHLLLKYREQLRGQVGSARVYPAAPTEPFVGVNARGTPYVLESVGDGYEIQTSESGSPFLDTEAAALSNDPYGVGGGTMGFPLPRDFIAMLMLHATNAEGAIGPVTVIHETERVVSPRQRSSLAAFLSGNRLVPLRPSPATVTDSWTAVTALTMSYIGLTSLRSLDDLVTLPAVMHEALIAGLAELFAKQSRNCALPERVAFATDARRAEQDLALYGFDIIGDLYASRVIYKG